MTCGSNIEEIINPMGVGLSNGGRRRLEALSCLVMSICQQNSMIMSANGCINGAITGFVRGLECNPMKVEMFSHTMSCEEDKTELMRNIDERMDMQSFDAIFMSFEAWSSSVAPGSALIRPSLDPNRDELILTQFVVNINFRQHIIMVRQKIMRCGKVVQLGNPDFSILDISDTRGVMSSFHSQTCPIT